MTPECKKAFKEYEPGRSTNPVDFQAALDAGINHAIDTIQEELRLYRMSYNGTTRDIQGTLNYPTDLCTLAATASRQLAVIQALEHILLDLGVDE